MLNKREYDAVVIGGGFYGCYIAYSIAAETNLSVLVLEQEEDLLQRASSINQARVHMGYHYPRNLKTAIRSCYNFSKFVLKFKPAIVDDFTKLYAVARSGSKVNAYTFHKTFKGMKAPIKVASPKQKGLFDQSMVEEVYEVKEYAFDHIVLKEQLKKLMLKHDIEIAYGKKVQRVAKSKNESAPVRIELADGSSIDAHSVISATYSATNLILSKSGFELLPFKHELTEISLVSVPEELKRIGITVMDGPFFSVMPYPAACKHSLTHVRYTPHGSWKDDEQLKDMSAFLGGDVESRIKSNYPYMLRSAVQFMPILKDCEYDRSIYEVKTVLLSNEEDDGRPILFRNDYGISGFHVVMGGKLDNVFDLMDLMHDLRLIGKRGK